MSRNLASIHHWQASSGMNPDELLRRLDEMIEKRLWEGEVGWDGRPMTLRRALAEPWPVGVGLTPARLERIYRLAEDADVDPALVRRVKRAVDEALAPVPPGQQTHCARGHEFTEENTHVLPSGERRCRACERERERHRRAGSSRAATTSNEPTARLSPNSSGHVRARLARDRPDLHEKVLAGELSVTAAARQAGIKRPARSIRIDSPYESLRALARIWTIEQMQEALAELEAQREPGAPDPPEGRR